MEVAEVLFNSLFLHYPYLIALFPCTKLKKNIFIFILFLFNVFLQKAEKLWGILMSPIFFLLLVQAFAIRNSVS